MPEGRLVICGTPIGNLGDISDRLRATLREADVVYAEDTRRTAKLLHEVGADTPMRSMFEGNEAERAEEVITALEEGKTVALVTDAGMPAISDPGARAVSLAHAGGYPVSVVPGPSAVSSAVALSGFGGDRFAFEGFLPRQGRDRSARLEVIAAEDRPVVLFASPNRLGSDLMDLASSLGGRRRIAITREMTKIHEEVWVGTLDEAVESWTGDLRGEITLVVEGGEPQRMTELEAVHLARSMIAEGATLSDAARRASEESGVSRRSIYQVLLEDQGLS